jgi:hypothetical protein
MTSKFQLDERANAGFDDASSYDKFRPSYPPEAVEKLLVHLGLSGMEGARVIDLASGTGKFTECMCSHPNLMFLPDWSCEGWLCVALILGRNCAGKAD